MSQRIAKVQSLIQQVVARELQFRLHDARLTVTNVDATPDLRQATVWLSVIADNTEAEQVVFRSAKSELSSVQSALARQTTTKFVPKLSFQLDTGAEHADRINKLISGL